MMCHNLLRRPWQFDRRVNYDGYKNKYSFMWGGQKMTLVPLSSKQILKDQLKMVHKKKSSEGEKILSEVESSKEKSVVSAQEKNRELV